MTLPGGEVDGQANTDYVSYYLNNMTEEVPVADSAAGTTAVQPSGTKGKSLKESDYNISNWSEDDESLSESEATHGRSVSPVSIEGTLAFGILRRGTGESDDPGYASDNTNRGADDHEYTSSTAEGCTRRDIKKSPPSPIKRRDTEDSGYGGDITDGDEGNLEDDLTADGCTGRDLKDFSDADSGSSDYSEGS